MDYSITFPGGEVLPGHDPIVVIGPNGSGKSRQTRQITSQVPIEFVNALRNTRVSPNIPAMGFDDARNAFNNQKNQARAQHWEITSDFDSMLSQLLARDAMAAKEFVRKFRKGLESSDQPELTPLGHVELIWDEVFPGRELRWQDWKPMIRNSINPSALVEYSGNTMSDGEKAALYLAGRVFSAEPGILIVDEPETHLHSLLAINLWDVLERERPDLRFIYITHDLTFALSRTKSRYALASPTQGLKLLNITDDLPSDTAEILLGSASLSFYASRIVFTEGTKDSVDYSFYNAWFKKRDTVVRTVGSCDMVIRCTDALAQSGIATSLTAQGIVDGDYHSDVFRSVRTKSVLVLKVHEIESLFCLPEVVAAVARHLAKSFDADAYFDAIKANITDQQKHRVIIERWKNRVEPELTGIVRKINNRTKPVDELLTEMVATFDQANWGFSPTDVLNEEKVRVEGASTIEDYLALLPGKSFVSVASNSLGQTQNAYKELVVSAILSNDGPLFALGCELETAISDYLPPRTIEA